jgi:drug/metabolite transporter (DMT)-like permease
LSPSPGSRSFGSLQSAIPALFVLLWSTGFIGAKWGLPYAGPFTFLAWRFALVVLLLGAVAAVTRAPWPQNRSQLFHLSVAGLLLHGVYLGGVFAAVSMGVPAGVAALISGLQPLLVAAAAGPLFGERVRRLQWLGLLLGLIGVVLVVWEKRGDGVGSTAGLALAVAALFGITVGTLYQKRFCAGMDLRTGSVVQFAAAFVLMLPGAWLLEQGRVVWTASFVFALAWLCLVLSVGAITLLFVLIRRGAAAQVASLFFLVPPATAALAWLLFGETLHQTALVGMAAVVVGVALANRKPKPGPGPAT